MAKLPKLLKAVAGAAGGAGLDVDEVFSTYLYTGTGSEQSINNGLDLSGEGGSVWIKRRDFTGANHHWFNTASGRALNIMPNQVATQTSTSSQDFKSFNNNGFTLNATAFNTNINVNNGKYVAWSFRKAPKFFDVVTYTGDGSTTKTVSHSLGSTPAVIFFKRTDADSNWVVYHANTPTSDGGGGNYTQPYLRLNGNFAPTSLGDYGNNLAPTSTVIRTPVHTNSGNTNDSVNVNGATYAAYIFAHNNSDGNFGPTGDQDIIKCGIFSTDSSGNATVNLGFEPQWLMVKPVSHSYGWEMYDQMRGFGVTGHTYLFAHLANAEGNNTTGGATQPTSTGFSISGYWGNNVDLIYMAIRRGPLAEPTSATDVFATDIDIGTSTGTNVPYAGFVTDVVVAGNRGSGGKRALSRLTNRNYMWTYNSDAESTIPSGEMGWDSMTGWTHQQLHASPNVFWQWARAPKFCDVVCYTGSGSAQNVTHNLGAVPEMMWFKRRDISANWTVYHKSIGNDKSLTLNDDKSHFISVGYFNNTTPTESVFSVGANHSVTNNNTNKYICYLFTSLSGISHVGGYTGTGNDLTIDCGFSSGARFVLIKREDRIGGSYGSNGDWYVYDSDRGIVSGNDPYLFLNNTDTEVTNTDYIDPHSSGFTVTSSAPSALNASGGSYIYYAIA